MPNCQINIITKFTYIKVATPPTGGQNPVHRRYETTSFPTAVEASRRQDNATQRWNNVAWGQYNFLRGALSYQNWLNLIKLTQICPNLITLDQTTSNLIKLDQIKIQLCRRSIGPFAHLFINREWRKVSFISIDGVNQVKIIIDIFGLEKKRWLKWNCTWWFLMFIHFHIYQKDTKNIHYFWLHNYS